jgi:glutamine amidotransferase
VSGTTLVVDYGMGNLASVLDAFERLGAPARLSAGADEVASARRLILPGVGAFGDAVAEIDRRALRGAILAAVRRGAPLLGICLGMQLLFEGSEESPRARGLGLLPGRVRRLGPGVRVPHVGWNSLDQVAPVPLLRGVSAGDHLYFVHSYVCDPAAEDAAAWFEYGGRCVAVAGRGRVWGVQAHPEKSQRCGETILRNFLELPAPPGAAADPGERRAGGADG